MHAFRKSRGLLWGLAVRGGAAMRLTDDNADEVLAEPHDWCWMHFALSDHRARRFLDGLEQAPAAARAMLLSGEARPRLHLSSGCAYGVIPDFQKDFDAGAAFETGRIAFWLDRDRLVTTRLHPMRIAEEVAADALAAPPPAPADIFVRLNERYVEIAQARYAAITHTLDRIEDMVLGEKGNLDLSGLGPARRELARYRREFASLRASYHRALSVRGTAPEHNPIWPHLGELLQQAEDCDRDATALAERARLLYEEMDTRIASAANRSLQALTVLSTLMLPPTFVVGAFGMNLPTIPWANTHGGFWWAIGLCVAVVAGSWALLKRFGIL